jgi:type 1 glutamine amidotransferase
MPLRAPPAFTIHLFRDSNMIFLPKTLRHFGLAGLLAVVSLVPVAIPAVAEEASQGEGWKVLFDGSSLDAWRGYNQQEVPKTWKIEGKTITCEGSGGDLITREKFENFELEFEWKVPPKGNSGVIYRVVETEQPSYYTGPEYQVLDNRGYNASATHPTAAGALYDLYPPQKDASREAGEWNQGRIVIDGSKVEHWLNGEKVVEADFGSDDWKERIGKSKFATWEGFAATPNGHIALQEHGNQVWYRNIRIRQLKEDKKASRPTRILFVTQSAGFKHPSVTRKPHQLSHAEQVMTELGIRSGEFRIDSTQDVEANFTPEVLEHYDVVMFFTTGDLPIPESTREWFLNKWLKQPGHGFLGVHSAADTYHNYEPYWDMIGGTFDGHPWGADSTVTVNVHDTEHPASQPWGREFVIKDEIYQFKNWQPDKVRVLMSLNMEKTQHKEPRHVPILWVKEYGEGRVMHMSLGHREDVWSNPTYQESLLGGIRWLTGQAEGDATPNPELSAEEEEQAKAAAN